MIGRILPSLIAGALLAGCSLARAPETSGVIDVSVLAINDFHGNLMPPAGGITVLDPNDPAKKLAVPAGGAEYLATVVQQLRTKNPNTIFVGAGDLIGASPLLSGLFHDEATVESLSLMGLELAAVGNHEFDEGAAELLRMQKGGCHPADGCKGPQAFTGAKFLYLAASTIQTATGKPLLPAYHIKTFAGVPVAFIGLTLRNTPNVVIPSGTAGLEFRDEAETVNALVPELRARGVETIVVLIHEGGTPTGDYNACPGISGPIVGIVSKFDKAVDVVVSGHTHQAYNCRIDGRLVTSARQYGTLVTEINLQIDAKTRDVVSAKAENHITRHDTYAKDPAQTKLIAAYAAVADPIANRVIGKVTERLTNVPNAAGESPLGGVIADALLAATKAPDKGGAEIAFMNRGGIRTEIPMRPTGEVTYADLFAVQPFDNYLVTLTLTGAQIKALLEQQWANPMVAPILQVSESFSYTWDAARAAGDKVLPQSMSVAGKPLALEGAYRVTVLNFIADGGDGFSVLRDGTDRLSGAVDIAATEAYFRLNTPVSPKPLGRIRRMN